MYPRPSLAVIILFLLCTGLSAGCLDSSFENVAYSQDQLTIRATNDGDTTQAVFQVTIFRSENLQQTEIFKKADYVTFENGENTYVIPVHLDPGTYKLYIYITVNNERKVSVIRDLTV